MYAGVPYAPVAPAYSLLVRDHHDARAVWSTRMRPGSRLRRRRRRVRAASPACSSRRHRDRHLHAADAVCAGHAVRQRSRRRRPRAAVDDAHATRRRPDTVAKVLFTSGSTGASEGRDQHAADALRQPGADPRPALPFLADAPPVLCDWLPWNHTFGGNHNFGIALYNGGTLYIDDGRPVPGADRHDGCATCARSRRRPTSTCPRASRCCCPCCAPTTVFRRHFFSRLQAALLRGRRAAPGGRRRACRTLAVATLGHARPLGHRALAPPRRAPFAMCTGPLRVDGRAHRRARPGRGAQGRCRSTAGSKRACAGPNVTPGYWRDDALTRAAFDEEGFYRMGDAIAPVDPDDLTQRLHVRRPAERGLQAVDRHLGARRRPAGAPARRARRSRAGRGASRGHARDDVRRADLPERCRVPRAGAAPPPTSPWRATCSPIPAVRDAVDGAGSAATTREHPGSSTAIRRARAARHAAVARTPWKSPTRARSTSGPCSGIAPPSSTSCTRRRPRTVLLSERETLTVTTSTPIRPDVS